MYEYVILIENNTPSGNPIFFENFKRVNKTSRELSIAELSDLGYAPFLYEPQPNADNIYEKVIFDGYKLHRDGCVRPIYRKVAKDIKENSNHAMSARIRSKRDDLLLKTDWTQLSDSTAQSLNWKSYRQELRDITEHPNFPYLTEKDWPNPPTFNG